MPKKFPEEFKRDVANVARVHREVSHRRDA
jgi:hypothetical protein